MLTFPPWTGFHFVPTLHSKPTPALEPASQSLPSPCVVCITGASRGLGAATAKAFAQAGATGLILTARTAAALEGTRKECEAAAKASLKVITLAANASSEASTKELAETIKSEFGRLDVLINNAGLVSSHPSAFAQLDAIQTDQILDVMQVNYVGKFLTSKYLIPLMLKSPNGTKTIINLTSLSSHLVVGAPGYSISELAINRLTETTAEMYREQGLLAYAVHPGMVVTTTPQGFPEAILQHCNDDVTLCGAFILWLIKERREWLSGRYLSVNWDVDELEKKRAEIVEGDKLKFRMVV